MKKLMLLLIFATTLSNFSCNKVCGCDIPTDPLTHLAIAIKSTTEQDLLSSTTSGYYSKSDIKLYWTDALGNILPIQFDLRVSKVNEAKPAINYIFSKELITYLRQANKVAFLKLRDEEPLQLSLVVNSRDGKVNFLINLHDLTEEPSFNKLFYYIK